MNDDRFQVATNQLDRILGFFPRVESKATFLFALDVAALTFMAVNVHRDDIGVWYIILPCAIGSGLLVTSIYYTYRCIFPNLSGGAASLFYFREIAHRTEAKFMSEFIAQSKDQLMNDVLGQVWRNSEILKMKFDAVKVAFALSALSVVPVGVFLVAVALTHPVGLMVRQ
ncbi:Pycsar system effector family protein [Pseudorhodoplanes sinuspersici]|uniref:Pycsar effector protein domain-containing protein n=1 Tax=Pseudorhodoplanes sinuspersici TaxID=1235591 RepID=A0A1W6ZQY7_9HYPH|nr:Pycsar system effector family protein [Pseudorhodoplanes sinuspersici]ARP99677.1 hypothetical protein CAK95_11705 [Pseudorhodoplanes sinuspersici]RKE70662.1 hypothetical protein DFP91_2903 [Pseudorhodoplanes sinuspersici]